MSPEQASGTALAQIHGLKVIARTSAFAFKGQHTDIRQIAEGLGASNILEGSVRRAGNQIRVTVQLVSAADISRGHARLRLGGSGPPVRSGNQDRGHLAVVSQGFGWAGFLGSGRGREAVEQLERAVHEDPLHLTYRTILALALGALERFDDADVVLAKSREIDPGFFWTYDVLASHYIARDMMNLPA